MPELPEIETIKNCLIPRLQGLTVTSVDLLRAQAVRGIDPDKWVTQLTGRQVVTIRRRGKYLLFDLSGGLILGIHLKMTGVLQIREATDPPTRYTTAIFGFSGRRRLHFDDQRKFGSLWLADDERDITGKLGPEPLEHQFKSELLGEIMGRHRIPVKAALCDQHCMAGLGNMYADEALYAAGVHPLTDASSLSHKRVAELHQAIITVLERGIRHNGASINTYCLPDGTRGMAQTQFRVAHREGEPCPVCGSPIERIKIRGRGACFCPRCQPA